MKQNLIRLLNRYVKVLRKHLKRKRGASLELALSLGRQAAAHGLEILELARIHECALVSLALTKGNNGDIKRAKQFFAEAIIPIVETHRAAQQRKTDLNRLNETLSQRSDELALTKRQLQEGILRRKQAEASLENSRLHYSKLLQESLQLQEGLRELTHQVLAAQEAERKNISCKLQDEIVQMLLGINVRLLTLKKEACNNAAGLKNEIASTQRLVVRSAKSVRRVAREFRNA
jgi:signal transduction histidine kinase